MKTRLPHAFATAWILISSATWAADGALETPARPLDARHAVVDRLIQEALARGEAYAKLQALCGTAPKRLSGSAGNALAIEWARAAMVADGLANVHLEACMVPHWERGSVAELSVLEPADSRDTRLPILALGGSVATPEEGLSAEVIEVHSFDELEQQASAAAGKIVFFNRPMDPAKLDTFDAYGGAVDQRSSGAVQAAKVGAVAAIVRSMTLRIDDLPHTGAMRYQEGVARVPSAALSTAGAERLSKLLKAQPKLRLRLRLDCKTLEDVQAHNVVGELTGSSLPEEIVLVGGHLDAWDVGQGANDDGAGCVQALEALRLIRVLELKPKRTLRVVLFANEENGLRGGRAYREAHKAELDQHVLALESDRGGFTPRGFETNANARALPVLRAICELFDDLGATRLTQGGGGADISTLEKDGVILMEYLPDGQRYFDVHHCERDTLENVHPRELELGACMMAAMLYFVADLDEAPPRNPLSR